MADKSISELVAATQVTSSDLFVLEQGGTAKKYTGQQLEQWLLSMVDGHGGITNISYTAPVAPSLVGTMTITLADETTTTVNVTNGKGISSVTDYWKASSSSSSVPSSWSTSRETMTTTNRYLWHYQRITYNDNTTTDTTKCVVGVYGDTGLQTYVWIRYAAQQPTQDSDISTIPDKYIGIYSGTASTAPTTYSSYTWYQYKGDKGDTGTPASVSSASITYQQSDSGSDVPEGTWSATVPAAVQGKYLWTRISVTFNTGEPVVAYSVAHYGLDGSGSVVSVNGVSPDSNGNVTLAASDISGIPAPSSSIPIMDGTAAAGSSAAYAREDHVHPSDTTKANASEAVTNVSYTSGKLQKTINGTTTDVFTSDTAATSGSANPIQSDAVYKCKPLHLSVTASAGTTVTKNDSRITSTMRLICCVFNYPQYVDSDVTWTTANGSITFTGTFTGSTGIYFDLIEVNE